jgi:hypothetical protein
MPLEIRNKILGKGSIHQAVHSMRRRYLNRRITRVLLDKLNNVYGAILRFSNVVWFFKDTGNDL